MRLRLVDANEILKSEHQHYDYMADEYYVLVRDIENAPTVDAEPVRHGHWERVAEQPYFRKHYHTMCCSECHSEGYAKWKYCPNCGARMDEVKDD